MRRRPLPHLLTVLALALSAVAFTNASATTSTEEPPSAPDQLLVGYEIGASANERAQARAGANAKYLETIVDGDSDTAEVELVQVRPSEKSRAERRFESNPNVLYAEPNWILTHQATSNDPYYTEGKLWGMYGDATSPKNQYGSQAGEAWAAGNTGSSNKVYVGIIDEGVQYTHPDLDGNIWTNPFDPADGADNDGNGYVDDLRGWDFYYDDNTTYDGKNDDHGTHVAGTVGAEGGNGSGVAGVVWDVELITAKFLGPRGGYTSDAVRAVDYITDLKTRHGLNVVATNNSWGGGGYAQSLYDAIERANAANILFIAAAGNGGGDGVGDDNDSTPHYPSSYANSNIIAVASITSTGSKSAWSNYGALSVDLGAPGSSIYSTVPDNSYSSYSGTSMATPHVTGAAVLYAAAKPGSSAATIKNAILTSTVPTASLTGITVSGGRLDVSGFVASTAGTLSGTVKDGTGAAIGDATVTVQNSSYTTSTTTGADGTYSLPVPEGTYTATASKTGFTSSSQSVTITAGQTTAGNFTLTSTAGTLSGTVKDGTGAAIGDATVTVQNSSYTTSTTTGADGTYSLPVPEGTYTATASKTGFTSSSHSVTITAGVTTTQNFTLAPSAGATIESVHYSTSGGKTNNLHLAITIRIMDGTQPVPNASIAITVSRTFNGSTESASGSGTTDQNGYVTFKWNNAPSGCYTEDVTALTVNGVTVDPSEPTATPTDPFCKS